MRRLLLNAFRTVEQWCAYWRRRLVKGVPEFGQVWRHTSGTDSWIGQTVFVHRIDKDGRVVCDWERLGQSLLDINQKVYGGRDTDHCYWDLPRFLQQFTLEREKPEGWP